MQNENVRNIISQLLDDLVDKVANSINQNDVLNSNTIVSSILAISFLSSRNIILI